jgi:acyl carrier protein
MTIETEIKNFIAQNLLFSDNEYNYPEEVSFLEEGIVDSIGVLELVTFVEEQFSITVDDMEVTPDNFDSVTKLASYIRRKRA